jgi:radical SAM protein with 4Fe4S-binding SPASM domain
MLFQWHITDRCNLNCRHCYNDIKAEKDPSFDELIAVLEKIMKFTKDNYYLTNRNQVRNHITLTGGEPFIHKDFLELLQKISEEKKHFDFAILTNGSFIDKSIARNLKKIKPSFVQVSIEGCEATHDSIRGKGNYRTTLCAIKNLVSENITTFISFTAHRGNFMEFAHVANLGRKLNVRRVWADRLIPCGSGTSLSNELLTPEETRKFFEIMQQECLLAKKRWFGKTEISMHRALQFLMAGGRPYHCTAGETLITVMPNGDVYPCRRMPVKVGNLFEQSLSEIYNYNNLLCDLRSCSSLNDTCKACTYSVLCKGGLKCLAYSVKGDPFSGDPGCWIHKNE